MDYAEYWDRITKSMKRVGDDWASAAAKAEIDKQYGQNYAWERPGPNYGPNLMEKTAEKPIIRDIVRRRL